MTGNPSVRQATQGRLILDPFIDAYGRIRSISPAAARAIPVYDKFGLLQGLAHDNGYYDQYLYDESSEWVEVLRTNDDGMDIKAYTFRLRDGFVDVWDATTGQSVRTWIDLQGQTFAIFFPAGRFDQASQSESRDYIAIEGEGCGGRCICQYGDDQGPCKGFADKASCETQEKAREYKGEKKNCVWTIFGEACL